MNTEDFLNHVKNHRMTVLFDAGVDRHIRFGKPDSRDRQFDLITWPGHLCYTGDMGTYVFKRLEDMFQFFRSDKGIKPDYWAEKMIAANVNGGKNVGSAYEFDAEAFIKEVESDRDDWLARNPLLSMEEVEDFQQEVQNQILDLVDEANTDAGASAMAAVSNFTWYSGMYRMAFYVFFDRPFRRPTSHYLWCCHALVWAIQQYDRVKASQTAQEEVAA